MINYLEDSSLKPSQIESLIEWMNKNWKNKKCTVCDNSNWEIQSSLNIGNHSNTKIGDLTARPTFPTVVAFCTQCGLMLQFSATRIPGLLSDKELYRGQ